MSLYAIADLAKEQTMNPLLTAISRYIRRPHRNRDRILAVLRLVGLFIFTATLSCFCGMGTTIFLLEHGMLQKETIRKRTTVKESETCPHAPPSDPSAISSRQGKTMRLSHPATRQDGRTP